MKHYVFTIAMLFVAGMAFGQKANVKKAKSALDQEKPNFNEAFAAINAAMQDETTKNDPETYNIAGKLHRKVYEIESLKSMSKQPYDTAKLYNSVLEMFKYYQLCDEKAQIPNAKGKLPKNKWREENKADMIKYHGQLFNAGAVIYLMQKKDYKKAVYFLGQYIDAANYPLLKDQVLLTDSLINQTAFYAAFAAYYDKDYQNVIKYSKKAINGTNSKDVETAYQILTQAYKAVGDTANWVNMLQESVKRNPTSESNIVQLINYYNEKGKTEEALAFADQLIAGDPNNDYSYFIKGYLLQNMEQLDKAIELYKKAISLNAGKAEYYSNTGTCYIGIAQDIDAKTSYGSKDYKDQQKIVNQNYMWAKENFEKVRELAPEKENLWVAPLYRIYYKLGIRQGEDFQMLEKKMSEREGTAN